MDCRVVFHFLQGKRRFDLEPARGPFGTKVRFPSIFFGSFQLG